MSIPKMPISYRGKALVDIKCMKNRREWTSEEKLWAQKMREDGFTKKEISWSMDRSEASVGIMLKRLTKKNSTYNCSHVDEKYEINDKFINLIKPKTVLDLYCGDKSFYSGKCRTTTNDINKSIAADYHEDAFRCICGLYNKKKKYDIVDLDPFGSAYDCFDIAIKMAKKGLVITLGELGHKRFKRLDFVERYYMIKCMDDFTIENLIKHIQQIAIRNKKRLVVYEYREWKHIGRVWFKVEKMNIESQWEGIE